MPGQIHPVKSTAALRTVTVRHASMYSKSSIHGAYRLTCLTGVDPDSGSLENFFGRHAKHYSSPPYVPTSACVRFQGGITKPHAGVYIPIVISLAKFTAPRNPAYGPL